LGCHLGKLFGFGLGGGYGFESLNFLVGGANSSGSGQACSFLQFLAIFAIFLTKNLGLDILRFDFWIKR
jgi:hypothetical protein